MINIKSNFPFFLKNLNSRLKKAYYKYFLLKIPCEPSRIRTYIKNLEGLCPNPLDDGPF